jgi:hypothetical protein
MVISYKCKKVGCPLHDIAVPELRCVRREDGAFICSECREPLITAETLNVSGRRDDRSRSRKESRPKIRRKGGRYKTRS